MGFSYATLSPFYAQHLLADQIKTTCYLLKINKNKKEKEKKKRVSSHLARPKDNVHCRLAYQGHRGTTASLHFGLQNQPYISCIFIVTYKR